MRTFLFFCIFSLSGIITLGQTNHSTNSSISIYTKGTCIHLGNIDTIAVTRQQLLDNANIGLKIICHRYNDATIIRFRVSFLVSSPLYIPGFPVENSSKMPQYLIRSLQDIKPGDVIFIDDFKIKTHDRQVEFADRIKLKII